MEEALAHIEIVEDDGEYVAIVQSELGGLRQYRGRTLEDALRHLAIELREEFDSITFEANLE